MTTTNISLDKTSHPGRTGTDELVPSRYVLRVGEIDVLLRFLCCPPNPGLSMGRRMRAPFALTAERARGQATRR